MTENIKIMKREISNKTLITSILLAPLSLMGQDEIVVETQAPLFSDTMSIVLMACVFIIGITAIFAIYKTLDLIVRVRELKIYEEHGLTDYINEKNANEGSWWHRFSRSMTAAVPIENEEDILFDHDYDGIRELDNSLPPWWLYGFYLTIVIAIAYMGYYHISSYGMSSEEEYIHQMEQAQKDIDAYL